MEKIHSICPQCKTEMAFAFFQKENTVKGELLCPSCNKKELTKATEIIKCFDLTQVQEFENIA